MLTSVVGSEVRAEVPVGVGVGDAASSECEVDDGGEVSVPGEVGELPGFVGYVNSFGSPAVDHKVHVSVLPSNGNVAVPKGVVGVEVAHEEKVMGEGGGVEKVSGRIGHARRIKVVQGKFLYIGE